MWKRSIAFGVAVSLVGVGCYPGRAGFGLFEAAVATAIIVSAVQPPPPRVIIVPEARPGYVWQPGYWSQTDGDWVWMDGTWIAERPEYRWVPTHWEQMPDGRWQLISGQWVPA